MMMQSPHKAQYINAKASIVFKAMVQPTSHSQIKKIFVRASKLYVVLASSVLKHAWHLQKDNFLQKIKQEHAYFAFLKAVVFI